MKPFDFRSAVMGARVQTRAGRMVTSVKSYPGNPDDEQLLVEFADGKREWRGRMGWSFVNPKHDLVMCDDDQKETK